MRIATSPSRTVTSRTMSSSVTGLRSSGSMTFRRAARTASCVAIGPEGSALEKPAVDLRDPPHAERQVPVLGGEACVDVRDPPGEPDAVAEGDELVLLALPEEHRHA